MRTIPLATLQAMYKVEADEYPIILLTLERTDESPANPQRISSDATERLSVSDAEVVYGTTSNSLEYYYLPFEITLASDQERTPQGMRIVMDNISAEIGWWLRESNECPTVTVEVVSSGDLDTPIATFPDFELRTFAIGQTLEAELKMKSLEHEPWPAGTFNPSHFPGLF